jgi:hypothetical protein
MIQKAINDCDQAITLNPKNAMAFGNRGASYSYLDTHTIAPVQTNPVLLIQK